jgi:toxin ParE1/3/4
MKYRVTLSPEAIEDFQRLFDYLLPEAGEIIARDYVRKIYDYCMSFETFPERGTRRDEREGLRTVGFRRKATIAFQVADGVVTIIRLFHGGQNVELSDEDS